VVLVLAREALPHGRGDRGNIAAISGLGNQVSAVVRGQRANKRAGDLVPIVQSIQAGGASLRQVAVELTRRGITTARGGRWSAVQVKRVLERV
jgi:hypothetical protein